MEPSREHSGEQERRRYGAIFESDMVGIMVADLAGPILDANDYFLDIVGYTRAELERGDLNWMKLTAPEYLERSFAAGRDIQGYKKVKSFEKEYICKDGHRVPVLAGLTLSKDGTIIAVILDLSQKKTAEQQLEESKQRLEDRVTIRTQELQQSEAFLEAIFENIPNMVFVKDAQDLKFVRFNRAGEELIGVPRAELMGKSDYDFFTKDQADFFTSKDREVLSRGRVEDILEEPINTVLGVRYLHTKKIPIFDKDGKAEYLLGVSEDITEKKEAEKQHMALLQEQIAREQAELRAQQMGFLSDISSILTESFEITKILKAFCRQVSSTMTDICIVDLLNEDGESVEITEVQTRDPAEEHIVKAWKKRHPLRWDVDRGLAKVLRGEKPVLIEDLNAEEFLRQTVGEKAAQDRPILVNSLMMTPIIMRDEKPVGIVTFLKKDETNKFNKLDLSLAEEITRRLAVAIENSRLYYKAQEANRAKSAFLANVSHEIRTPLGAMLGFAEVLDEDESLSEKQKNAVRIVLRNGQQLLRIVDEILDISKVESERIQIEHITFSLLTLLEDVVLLLKGRADEKNIDLKVTYEELPLFICTDPTRLRQILINVIGNAIKFTDFGEVEVKVAAKKSADGEKMLEFRVRDTGIGISEEQRSQLFQAFAQADNSTTRRFGGTGLGLFLSRNLARLLGGDVVLDRSTAGEGSHFVITVTYEESHSQDLQKNGNKKPQTSHGFPHIKNILIVDDASDNRDLFRHHLKKMGLRDEVIDTAANGVEAVNKALHAPYSLILMDIQMPEMDGFQALDELRKKSYRGLIVALTAHAMKGDEEKCLAAGFDGYLQKPLSKEALRIVLERTNARKDRR